LKLVSWNLNGLEDKNLDMRTEAAMFNILLGAPIEHAMKPDFKANSPDIVVLQEVVSRTFHAHITPHLQAAGFQIFPKEPTDRSYFELIAVRQAVLESSYKTFSYTSQGRGLSMLKIDGLTIFTAHLESMKPGASMRIDQAREILEIMNKHEGPCIFAGDTNLRKAEWDSLEPKDVEDAWISTGSIKKYKNTWQTGKSKARFDRAWLKNCSVEKFELFGKKKVAVINERASDHLALRVEFRF